MKEFLKLFLIALVAGVSVRILLNALTPTEPLFEISDLGFPLVLSIILALLSLRFTKIRTP